MKTHKIMNKFTLSIILPSFFITSDFVDVALAANESDFVDVALAANEEAIAIWRRSNTRLAAQVDEEKRLKELEWNELMKPKNLEKSINEERAMIEAYRFDNTVTLENYPWMDETWLAAYKEYGSQLFKELELEIKPGKYLSSTHYRDFNPEDIIQKKRDWLEITERYVIMERTGKAKVEAFNATVTFQNHPWMEEVDLAEYQTYKPEQGYLLVSHLPVYHEMNVNNIIEQKRKWLEKRKKRKEEEPK